MTLSILSFDAVIFDMDGLLLDSESIALSAFTEASKNTQIPLSNSVFNACVGANRETRAEILKSAIAGSERYTRFTSEWDRIYSAYCEDAIPLMDGALEFLKFLKAHNKRFAVATSTPIAIALSKLKKSKILDYFEFVIGGDQVSAGKPDPELYLTAAERLGVVPEKCLALEDSKNGTLSAFRAGMLVVQIPNMIAPDEELIALGHPIMQSLNEVLCFDFERYRTANSWVN